MPHLLVAIIPLCFLLGWLFGKKYYSKPKKYSKQFHRDYFRGLNYLINEEPDKAVDIFIKLLEVDSDTVEIHIALGNLYRRRGEVDRAIRIHQHLIARPNLAKANRLEAMLELAKDYMRAGVLDRAEKLFQELVIMKEKIPVSLKHLLNIYQQEKDWEQAINIAKQLSRVAGISFNKEIAHFHCELAEIALAQEDLKQSQAYLQTALKTDAGCTRASILKAQLAEKQGDYRRAVKFYKQVEHQDADYVGEIINSLSKCYHSLDREEFVKYLQNKLENYPHVSIVLAFSNYLRLQSGDQTAIHFLTEQIKRYPSFHSLNHLISIYMDIADHEMRDRLQILYDLVNQLLVNRPAYRCRECGIATQTLYWQCPGCKSWSSIRPILGL